MNGFCVDGFELALYLSKGNPKAHALYKGEVQEPSYLHY